MNNFSVCDTPHLPHIAIIIPYFQREEGILARALRSIAAQDYTGPCTVIVIDDASPHPADKEIQNIVLPESMDLKLIHQPNSGPGGARNRGLDELGASTDFVAFLDSDDEWAPNHLDRAVTALEQSYDFYFSDIYQLDQKISAFARGGKINLTEHRQLSTPEDSYEYIGDMIEQILFGNIIGTPSVVYRLQPLASLRFQTALHRAGEDYLFWIDCAKACARFCFSSRVEVRCGHGINIFSGVHWGTPEHLQRTTDELTYRRTVLKQIDASSPIYQKLQDRISILLTEYSASFWSSLFHQPWSTITAFLTHCQQQTDLFRALPRRFIKPNHQIHKNNFK